MFTGLISEIGRISDCQTRPGIIRLKIDAVLTAGRIQAGDSVAVNGICLTAVQLAGAGFWVEAMPETYARTTLAGWRVGTAVNLERPLRLDSPLDGHLVSGHVDGIGEVESVKPEGLARRLRLHLPEALWQYMAAKGSVALDGVSLTVAEVMRPNRFEVALIPHTLQQTTLGGCGTGCRLNIEIDLLARYVARLLETRFGRPGVTAENLRGAGF